ncbi:MAG: hypothetical protein ACREXR_00220 [Gammaproteobacteria bacterium]
MEIFTVEFWKGIWDDFVEYFDDWPIRVLKGILESVLSVLQTIAPPDFLSTHRLGDVLAPVMPYIGYFLAQAGISQGLSLIATAVVFRVTRRILTFGKW